jgi:hypothetical protein
MWDVKIMNFLFVCLLLVLFVAGAAAAALFLSGLLLNKSFVIGRN